MGTSIHAINLVGSLRLRIASLVVVVTAVTGMACGGGDSENDQLRTAVAELQTQVASSTPTQQIPPSRTATSNTPTPSSTPTPAETPPTETPTTAMPSATPVPPSPVPSTPTAPQPTATPVPPAPLPPTPTPVPPTAVAPTPAVATDVVVGVALRCLWSHQGAPNEIVGDDCRAWSWSQDVPGLPAGYRYVYSINHRWAVLLRKPDGGHYEIAIPASLAWTADDVPYVVPPAPTIGSSWPP